MTTKTIPVPSPHISKTNQSRKKNYPIKVIIWLVAIVLGAIQAWSHRFSISSEDGISYLDIADAYLRGDWNLAINPHWSPLYTWLIGLALYVLKPSPYWEFATVKLVNFIIYLFTLLCFDFLLRNFLFHYNKKLLPNLNGYLKIPEGVLLVLGYTAFLWASLRWIGVFCDSPDMLTAAFVYLAAGIVLHINARSARWFNFVMLGVVLGFGYLSKTVMFPVAFVFLGVAMFAVGNFRKGFKRTIAALLVFTVVVAPFITAISVHKGHVTIGEAGKLSYAWYISPRVADHHWQGKPPGSGTPEHTTRQIFTQPAAYEFGTPISTTYPVWFDPSYWNEGLKPKFNLNKQIRTIAKNTLFYGRKFLLHIVFCYLILVCVAGKFWPSIKNLTANWYILLPAVAGLGIFLVTTDMPFLVLPTHASPRYLAPFIVLLFAAVFSSLRLPDSKNLKKWVTCMILATLLVNLTRISLYTAQDLSTIWKKPDHTHLQIAESLHQLGIKSGAKVAKLGLSDYYWARLARTKIVAEIPDGKDFWSKDEATRANAIEAIAKTGAEVIVQQPGLKIPNSISKDGWIKLGNTKSYAYLLRN